MKKTFVKTTAGMLALALTFVFVLAGCDKGKKDWGVYDPTVSADQLCTLEIQGSIHVNNFDGKAVGGKRGWFLEKGSGKSTRVQIPSGTHTLGCTFWLYTSSETTFSTSQDEVLTQKFEPGKTYRLSATLHLPNNKEVTKWGFWRSHFVSSIQSVSFNITEKE